MRWQAFSARAAVAGLWRPLVFCDPQVPEDLAADELRAVVLHERAHQLQRDPLRLLVLAAVAPLVSPLPAGRAWLERQRAGIEIRADRFALHHGASRPGLAAALLTLGRAEHRASVAGYTCASELRLRWLVDGEEPTLRAPRRPRELVVLAVGFLLVGLCAAGWMHHTMTVIGALACAWPGS